MKKTDRKRWHPAFCSATEWELRENKDDLSFESEHQLNNDPLRADLLVIKKAFGVVIKNEIGKIFLTHNIVEFKSEGDNFSIDDYYKVIGYACIYKSQGKRVNEIPASEISITIIRVAYPREVFSKLREVGVEIEERYRGIFYLSGKGIPFPIQVISTRRMGIACHPALRVLTNKADEADVRAFIQEANLATEQGDINNINSILQVSVSANRQLYDMIRKESNMCEALQELFKEEIEEKISKEHDKTLLDSIRKVMSKLQYTADQAMDILDIPTSERKKYISML